MYDYKYLFVFMKQIRKGKKYSHISRDAVREMLQQTILFLPCFIYLFILHAYSYIYTYRSDGMPSLVC